MPLFGQFTRLRAIPGSSDALVAKFIEAANLQRDNRSCHLMTAGKSVAEGDVVYLVEIWSSEDDWERVRTSEDIKVWAEDMPGLVAATPESVRFEPSGGKGLLT